MPITQDNINRTRREVAATESLLNEMLPFAMMRQGSAEMMSNAELERMLRNTTNALIAFRNAFTSFLDRVETDSRLRR